MRGFPTLRAAGIMLAVPRAVSKALTCKAPQRVGDENANVVPNVASEEGVGKFGRVESDNQETGVTPLAITEGGQTADMRDPFRAESVQDLILGHVAHLRSKNSTFGGVASVMEGDSHFLLTEVSALEQGFGLSAGLGFHDESAIGGSFNIK